MVVCVCVHFLAPARRLQGTMSIPLYLTSVLPGSHLVINKTSGLPVYQGDAEAIFTVRECTVDQYSRTT